MNGLGLLAFLMEGLAGMSVSKAVAETTKALPPGATARMTTLSQVNYYYFSNEKVRTILYYFLNFISGIACV